MRWRGAVKRAVHARCVVIVSECRQLPRQVDYVPEEHAIEIFVANGADHPFDERMRNRDVRNRLDLLDPKYPQVGEPTVEAKQWVVVGAEVPRSWLTGERVIEHPANRDTVNISGLDAESDEPAREYVHDHHDPMTAQ